MFGSNRHGCRYLDYSVDGNRFLTLENSLIKFTFWLNKGADLVEVRHKPSDVDVMWRTPMPMPPAAGRYISPASAPIGNFFDYYPGGWQEVFPNAHLPTSEYKNAPLGLHGEVCLLPWEYSIEDNTEDLLRVKLQVRTARTPFTLEKIVTLRSGESFFTFDERILNESSEEMRYNWGHHPVFGAPFIEEGCVIDAPQGSTAVIVGGTPKNERFALGQRSPWPQLQGVSGETLDASRILGPSAGSADSFHMEVKEGWAAIRNPRLDLGVGIAWELDVFPYLWIWQACCGSLGYPFYKRNYNVAIEPYSVPVETLSESVQSGTAHVLEPFGTKTTRLAFGFTQGKQPVNRISTDGKFE